MPVTAASASDDGISTPDRRIATHPPFKLPFIPLKINALSDFIPTDEDGSKVASYDVETAIGTGNHDGNLPGRLPHAPARHHAEKIGAPFGRRRSTHRTATRKRLTCSRYARHTVRRSRRVAHGTVFGDRTQHAVCRGHLDLSRSACLQRLSPQRGVRLKFCRPSSSIATHVFREGASC